MSETDLAFLQPLEARRHKPIEETWQTASRDTLDGDEADRSDGGLSTPTTPTTPSTTIINRYIVSQGHGLTP